MKVLLWQDIYKLGKLGDVVEVADGYARNFLLPRKLASKPTEKLKRSLETQKLNQFKKETKVVEQTKILARKIEDLSCTIEMKSTKEGTLYGSVTKEVITELLAKQNIVVDPKSVILDDHIKETGIYHIEIDFGKNIKTTLRLWVVEESVE